jgi:translation initiation factor IF-1
MSVKEEKIEVEGEVVEALPSTMFRVLVDGGSTAFATVSRSRITYRHR